MKHPGLIRWVYAIGYIVQFRKWYLQPAIGRLLRSLPPQFTFVDAGSGEGQYLFPHSKKHPSATFIGIDKSLSNINFCNAYIQHRPFGNVRVLQGALEGTPLVKDADVVVCVGVLQYIEDDKQALQSINGMLKPGGTLLLEVPVNGDIVLPLYRHTLQRFDNYDVLQGRKRIYLPQEVLGKISAAGFSIKQTTYTYGFWGKLGYELFNIPLLYLMNGSIAGKVLAAIAINIINPFTMICYFIDYCMHKQDGNAMIVVAEKR